MGKFSRNREYTFVSMEEFVTDVMEAFGEGQNIDVLLSWEEVPKFLIPLLATEKFTPYDIRWGKSEMDGYGYEYNISLSHMYSGEDAIFVEQIYNTDSGRYLDGDPEIVDIAFLSVDVSTSLYNKYIEDGYNTVLFDIED